MLRPRGRFLLVVGLLLCLADATLAGGPPVAPTYNDLHYDGHFQQKLDLYLPVNACEPLPVAIFIFGGGWSSGIEDDQVQRYLEPLLSRGFAVASISHRWASNAIFPAPIHDCKGAIRWLRAHAHDQTPQLSLNLDTTRFAIFGDSSGGHLAALVGTSAGVASLEGDEGGNLAQSSAVQVVGDFAGPTDLIALMQATNSGNVAGLFGYTFASTILSNLTNPNPPWPATIALITSANPAVHASVDDPPFWIVNGQNDASVPPSQAQHLHNALGTANVPSQLTILPGVRHDIPLSAYIPIFDYFVATLNPDSDGDGTPDACDGCPADPDKIAPGICGCGVADTDTDGDGVADCIDGCPDDPLKIAPGICGCGVPDTDSDGDGTADCIDGCPLDPNKIAPGICGCGIPDTDTDGDGAADCIDGCPRDPTKTNPGVCGCGVPDIDTDGDGIADCIDRCPGIPNTLDTDGDGTPDCFDGCPLDPDKIAPGICGCGIPDTDSDGDGTANCLDGCPDDPLKIEPGICGCGVPDTDTDGDGVADCLDGCPLDPEKTNPGICGCGVPDIDSDGDGTPDCNDQCPDDPTKIVPGQCGCGNPDTDTDRDGVADCIDNCDNTPNATQADCDRDGIGDACEGEPDCNNNGVPDSCDIAAGAPDINGNGIPDTCECIGNVVTTGASAANVDVDDLLAVITAWGPCPASPEPCPANIVHLGAGATAVNVDDLLAVITNWGPCD